MQTSQMSCPYCKSTISFGADVAAGSVVSCLMCLRSFAAESITHSAVSAGPAQAPGLEDGAVGNEAIAESLPLAQVLAEPQTPRPTAPPMAPLRVVLPTAVAPCSSSAALIVGGVMLGGMGLLVVVGLGLIGFTLIFGAPRSPIPAVSDPVPLAQQPTPMPDKTAPADAKSALQPADGDVADVKTASSKAKTPVKLLVKAGGEPHPQAGPGVPVIVVAGNVPGVDQVRIDAAIAKGVQYLKDQQQADGTWAGGPRIGYAALAGLTLLECKVPANDPHVVKAAHFVRNNIATLDATYELSLAILFLDRLGKPHDRIAIQGMALRLLAGQNDAGGWTYKSHNLTPPQMHQLLVFLKSHRPELPKAIGAPGNLGKPVGGPGDLGKSVGAPADLGKSIGTPNAMPKSVDGKSDDPFQQLADLLKLPKAIQEPGPPSKQEDRNPLHANPPALVKPLEGKTDIPGPAKSSDVPDKTAKGAPAAKARPRKLQPINPNRLPPPLQQLPVVWLNAKKGKVTVQRAGGGDNSNSQFALLGLWAARRHDVPTEYSLHLAKQRYTASQNADGGWGYHLGLRTTNTMTNVGLIGLAMGHGALPDALGKAPLGDAAIHNGLHALGKYIGTPSLEPDAKPPMQNMYFLWSVERVAMLYDLKTIGGKDWYGWGAQTLLPNQSADGHWLGAGYPGTGPHTDTCFALLFLKRSNLVPDLTENIRLYMVIRDPEAK
jgi:hypothetical protein